MEDVLLKKQTYFGFKFHALTTIDGFLTDYVITPANIDDREAVWDLCENIILFLLLVIKDTLIKG